MGYKKKNIIKASQEAPFFILEKNIFKALNVCSLGYVTGRVLDERLNKKVYKYIIKMGPIGTDKNINDYITYDATCLEGVDITLEEINSGTCLVLVVFLDTNPLNFYKQVHGFNKKVEDKLSTTENVEYIMHDYRNAVIVGKLKVK